MGDNRVEKFGIHSNNDRMRADLVAHLQEIQTFSTKAAHIVGKDYSHDSCWDWIVNYPKEAYAQVDRTPEDEETFPHCDPGRERSPPAFNPWRDILIGDYIMVILDTIEKCMGLEIVWLGKAITRIDNNVHEDQNLVVEANINPTMSNEKKSIQILLDQIVDKNNHNARVY